MKKEIYEEIDVEIIRFENVDMLTESDETEKIPANNGNNLP